jgi:hypothetical protein
MLSTASTTMPVCDVKLFIWYVAVCCLCVCVPEACTHRQHTDIQETYTRQHTKNANKQRSSSSTKHKRWSPEDGQTIVNETCRVLMMCFKNIINNLVF